MKRFNTIFFIVCSVILAGIAYESYIQAVAIDEGRAGANIFRILFADLFNVMRFPTHVILARWSMNPLNFSIGLMINCLLYSFMLERMLYLITRPKAED